MTQDTPAALPVQELTIDGHKGEEAIRRYVATMARTQVLNQWLADVYCNELRKIYTAQFAYDASDERDAEFRANNKIADLWRQRKDYLGKFWPVEYRMEYAEAFPAEHCKVTEALMASLHEFVPAQAATSAAGGATGEIETLLDAADEWANYVIEDRAPMTLRKYLERALAQQGAQNGR